MTKDKDTPLMGKVGLVPTTTEPVTKSDTKFGSQIPFSSRFNDKFNYHLPDTKPLAIKRLKYFLIMSDFFELLLDSALLRFECQLDLLELNVFSVVSFSVFFFKSQQSAITCAGFSK